MTQSILQAAIELGRVELWCPAPVVNYDMARSVAKRVLTAKVEEARGYAVKLHKAQQAAENVLDMYREDGVGRM